jgi:hypothetical protein
MPDRDNTLDHIRHIDIPITDLDRWEATTRRLEPLATAPLVAVFALRTDPCKYRFYRAGCASRYAASISDGPVKTEAIAPAEELERRSV